LHIVVVQDLNVLALVLIDDVEILARGSPVVVRHPNPFHPTVLNHSNDAIVGLATVATALIHIFSEVLQAF